MQAIALEGFWLLAAFAIVYLVGVFTSQWAKDKLSGVPSDLRSALKTLEAGAVKELAAARAKLVADTVNLISRGKAAAATEVKVVETKVTSAMAPAVASAPVAAAPAATQ